MNIKNKLTIEQANVLYSQACKQVMEGVEYNYRLGQAIFNLLYDHHKHIAETIRTTEYDMFYKDDDTATDILYNNLTERSDL